MAMNWKVNIIKKLPKLKNPILIEGLPGIGNVGKVAVDFMIEELDAQKCVDFMSYSLPHTVFINEQSLVELPVIELYHKKVKDRDVLLLAGDVHPEDQSCYEFCDVVLDFIKKHNCKEVITLGGIGLQNVPENPQVFVTGTSKKIIDKFTKGLQVKKELYGVVGPIVGASGLLLGLGKKNKIEGICFLAETYGHPMYLGIKGAKELLKIIQKKIGIKVDIKKIDKEIAELEKELLKRSQEGVSKKKLAQETSYIG